MNAAAWFNAQSFHQHREEPATAPAPRPQPQVIVFDRWDAEARRWRTYEQNAAGEVREVTE